MPQTDYSGIASSAKLNGTLSASAGPGTVITVDTAAGWPTGATGIPFVGTFGRGTSSEEKVLFSLRSGNNLTISQRGYDDTVAADHGNGEPLLHTTDATILRTTSAHIYDTTRNDHTQYARKGFVNTFTAAQTVSAAANEGLILYRASNVSADTAGLQFAHNNNNGAQVGSNAVYSVLTNGTAGAETAKFQFHTINAGSYTVRAELSSAGGVSAIGPDHYFGANALGATGTRLHLGSMGSVNSAFIKAEGDAGTPNVAVVLESKGNGSFIFAKDDGTNLFVVPVSGVPSFPNIVTSTTASGGSASVLPAAPLAYLPTTINGVSCKIPYYAV